VPAGRVRGRGAGVRFLKKLVMKKKIYEVPVMKPVELRHKGNLLQNASANPQAVRGLDTNSGLGLDWQEGGFEDEDDDN